MNSEVSILTTIKFKQYLFPFGLVWFDFNFIQIFFLHFIRSPNQPHLLSSDCINSVNIYGTNALNDIFSNSATTFQMVSTCKQMKGFNVIWNSCQPKLSVLGFLERWGKTPDEMQHTAQQHIVELKLCLNTYKFA